MQSLLVFYLPAAAPPLSSPLLKRGPTPECVVCSKNRASRSGVAELNDALWRSLRNDSLLASATFIIDALYLTRVFSCSRSSSAPFPHFRPLLSALRAVTALLRSSRCAIRISPRVLTCSLPAASCRLRRLRRRALYTSESCQILPQYILTPELECDMGSKKEEPKKALVLFKRGHSFT